MIAQGVVAVLVTDSAGGAPSSIDVPVLPGYGVAVLTPSGEPLTGPDGDTVVVTTAFAAVQVGDYAVLALPGGAVGARLQDDPAAVGLLRQFAASGALSGAATAGPCTMIDASAASGVDAVAWQEVGPGIREVSGTGVDTAARGVLPRHLVRVAARVFEQVP